METLRGNIFQKYFFIKQKISNWNFDKLTGIGKKRTDRGYAILELNIYTLNNYPYKEKIEKDNGFLSLGESYLIWELSESQFPKAQYEFGKEELVKSAEEVIDLFSIIKEERLSLVFEIIWAGYSITDFWGRGVVNLAFVSAVSSCFDKVQFQLGLESKKRHPFINGEYQSRYS